MKRRSLIKGFSLGFLLKPFSVLADWNNKAFWAAEQGPALEALFAGVPVNSSEKITIGINSMIENGAVVPIKITTSLPDVTSISIFVENNPNPLIAHFELNPRCLGFVATRIKVDKPSNITAIVRSEETLFQTSTYIEVAEGGCG